jgi:internalin A
LQLAQCELEEIPALIGGFLLLRMLDLSDNKLEAIPSDIGNCFSLKKLNISSNKITNIPEELAQLIHLKEFYFYSNRIVELPEWVGKMNLTNLNGFNNKILHLPLTLGGLSDLSELNLSCNVIMQLPPAAIANWRSVTILNLFDCRLLQLPSLGHLESLQELRLFNNNLEVVPDLGTKLGSLRVVEINKNRISALPLSFFSGLRALEKINLAHNSIDAVPVGINCPKLEHFLINNNNLTELPPDLPLWPSLRVLFVNVNQLQRLPETFLQNTQIERINLSRNSRLTVPSKHILQHLKKVIEGKPAALGAKYWAPDSL